MTFADENSTMAHAQSNFPEFSSQLAKFFVQYWETINAH